MQSLHFLAFVNNFFACNFICNMRSPKICEINLRSSKLVMKSVYFLMIVSVKPLALSCKLPASYNLHIYVIDLTISSTWPK